MDDETANRISERQRVRHTTEVAAKGQDNPPAARDHPDGRPGCPGPPIRSPGSCERLELGQSATGTVYTDGLS